VLRAVPELPVGASRNGGPHPGESRDTKDAPPVRAQRGRLCVLATFARHRPQLLELLRPGDSLRPPPRLLRLARVDEQAALLEQGNRAGGRLLTRLARSHLPQEPLHPPHGQEDALLLLESLVLLLACSPPDMQAEGIDRLAPVFIKCAPLLGRKQADGATYLPDLDVRRKPTRRTRRYVKSTIGRPR
jgi:hypothetical protein